MIGLVDKQNPKRRGAEDAESVFGNSLRSLRFNRFFNTADFRVLRRLLFFFSRSRYCAMHGVKIGGLTVEVRFTQTESELLYRNPSKEYPH